MNYFIVTGTSRGIGEAIVRKLLVSGNTIFGAARNLNEELSEIALSLHIPFYFYETDLANPHQASLFVNNVFSKIDLQAGDRIALINNAGMLEPVASVDRLDAELLQKHISLNLITPMLLSSAFIAATKQNHNVKVILNISSGASMFPYKGWSVYGASKAGIDMFSRVAGLEQSSVAYPVKVFALAPGIIETDMQIKIRATTAEDFPAREDFIKLFEDGKLLKSDYVASIIVQTLFSSKIENGEVTTLKKLLDIIDN